MHDVQAKDYSTRIRGWLPPRSAFKLFNAQPLIIPLIAMVICQHHILKMLIIFAGLIHGHLPSYRQVKTSIALCSAIFDRKGKNDGYFHLLCSLVLAFCQLQSDTEIKIVR